MAIRYRLMQSRDIPECTAIIARHPVLGPRYGEAIGDLGSIWSSLLAADGCVSAVFEECQGEKSTLLGGGSSLFVKEEFVATLKAAPHFWIGPEVIRRIQAGNSPVLSDKSVRDANASCGLVSAVWHTGVLPESLACAEVGNTVQSAFMEMHRGYKLKEVLAQGESLEHLRGARAIGLSLWKSRESKYGSIDRAQPRELLERPHVLGISRELALNLVGYWGALSFLYQAPRFGFSRGEQKLLSCGLLGGTDHEIAEELGVSIDAVRKTWRTIYGRVTAVAPDLLPSSTVFQGEHAERGKGKKQRLLAYIHAHPQELRPTSRSLLKTFSAS
jgi:DNA-binding CsgD family transcriptional regulator